MTNRVSLRALVGDWSLLELWGESEGKRVTYHGLLCLDGFHLETFLPLRGSVAEVLLLPKGSLSLPARWPGLWVAAGISWWRGSRMHISTLLLGDVSLWAMHCLHMFPEGAGVCVALGAAWDLAYIRFLPSHTRKEYRFGYENDYASTHQSSLATLH